VDMIAVEVGCVEGVRQVGCQDEVSFRSSYRLSSAANEKDHS